MVLAEEAGFASGTHSAYGDLTTGTTMGVSPAACARFASRDVGGFPKSIASAGELRRRLHV